MGSAITIHYIVKLGGANPDSPCSHISVHIHILQDIIHLCLSSKDHNNIDLSCTAALIHTNIFVQSKRSWKYWRGWV